LFGIDWSPVKPPANHDPKAIQLALEARVRRVADAGAEEQKPELGIQSTQGNRCFGGEHNGGSSDSFGHLSCAHHARASTPPLYGSALTEAL
jgi:hypothetical protein